MAETESYQKPEDYSVGETASTINVKFLSSTAVGVTLYFLSGRVNFNGDVTFITSTTSSTSISTTHPHPHKEGLAYQVLDCGAIGTTLVGLSGLTLTGTVIALIMATPVLVFFSPVLVPAAIVMFLIAAGFVFSGGCGVAAITALTWLYKYASNYISTGRRNYTYDGSYASQAQFGRL
ncbi:hypothetical protein ACLB2K_014967 [Fragaria x ananassa]